MTDKILLFVLIGLMTVYFIRTDKPLQQWLETTIDTVGVIIKFAYFKLLEKFKK